MKGEWEYRGGGRHVYVAGGAAHAQVYKHHAWGNDLPWVVFTTYNEGNHSFAELDEAKAHGEKLLQKLLDATESLR